ncbi:MAG: hypothetical protein A2Y79_02055 [Deltaproteobacteria bacterium RBG_13_43_22]|nr:MAG: hypothetical protein A2Y79_02055 [Deltaproteobacteria bacterium RBG_13_43_22]
MIKGCQQENIFKLQKNILPSKWEKVKKFQVHFVDYRLKSVMAGQNSKTRVQEVINNCTQPCFLFCFLV